MSEGAIERKRGGGLVFVAIFLGPFLGAAAVAMERGLALPTGAPIAFLTALHLVVLSQFIRMTVAAGKRTSPMVVWSAAVVVADVMWFGVLLTLAAAVTGSG